MSIKTEIELDPSKGIEQAGKAADAIGDKLSKSRVWSDDLVKTATAKGAAIGGNAGYGLQKVAQFADDAQYGLRGVTNNISDTLMALGAGAGLAGAATIAAVAVQTVLVPALEKLAMGETEVARAARLQAAAELDSLQATRRKAIEAKASGKAHTEWAARLSSASDVIREQNSVIDSNIAATTRWNEVRNANAITKIQTSDDPEATKIKKISDLETAAAAERVRLDKSASEAVLANNKKLYEQEQKLFDETQTAIGKARAKAKAYWSSAAEAGTRGGDSSAYRATAMQADKELAALTAKRDELAKTLPGIKQLYDEANKDYAKAIEAEKLLQIQQETNTLKVQDQITKILKENAKARMEEFSKVMEVGNSIKSAGAEMNQKKTEEDAKQAESRRVYDAELEIQALQSRGHDRKAEKLKKELEIHKQTQDLIKMGFSEKDASSRAKKESDLKEDADFRKRTGRSRFHGVKGQESFQGISNGNEYGGLNYLDMGRDRFGSRRVGDSSFGRLDKMEAMQNDPRRNQPKSTVVDAPAKPTSPPGVAELTKALESLNSTLVPALKKYAAEPLAKNS